MASIYQRGKWWWIAYFLPNGKRAAKNLRVTKKTDAERIKKRIEVELADRPERFDTRNPLVDVFWDQYSAWAEQHLRKPTREIIERHWRQLIGFTGAKRLGDVRQKDVEAFKASRKGAGAADRSVNNALKDIKAVYNRAIKLGLFSGPNPAQGVERFKLPQRMPEFHTEEEVNRLLEAAQSQGRHTEWTVLLGVWAGLRRKEIVSARWEWFDWDPEKPTIQVKGFDGFDVKDYEDRSIPMNRRIYEALRPHREKAGFVFESGRSSEGKHRYRFEPKRGLLVALREAELTTKGPFQRLRHTFGSLLAQKGVSIFKIALWMGHSDVKVTQKHYAGLQVYDEDIDRF